MTNTPTSFFRSIKIGKKWFYFIFVGWSWTNISWLRLSINRPDHPFPPNVRNKILRSWKFFPIAIKISNFCCWGKKCLKIIEWMAAAAAAAAAAAEGEAAWAAIVDVEIRTNICLRGLACLSDQIFPNNWLSLEWGGLGNYITTFWTVFWITDLKPTLKWNECLELNYLGLKQIAIILKFIDTKCRFSHHSPRWMSTR